MYNSGPHDWYFSHLTCFHADTHSVHILTWILQCQVLLPVQLPSQYDHLIFLTRPTPGFLLISLSPSVLTRLRVGLGHPFSAFVVPAIFASCSWPFSLLLASDLCQCFIDCLPSWFDPKIFFFLQGKDQIAFYRRIYVGQPFLRFCFWKKKKLLFTSLIFHYSRQSKEVLLRFS